MRPRQRRVRGRQFLVVAERPVDEAAAERIARLTVRLARHEVELIADVADTLEELGRHNSGEITVNDGGERVRIWVDGKNESD